MPKYRYQAADTQGNPVSGELEATGIPEARQKLAAQGFDAERAAVLSVSRSSAEVLVRQDDVVKGRKRACEHPCSSSVCGTDS